MLNALNLPYQSLFYYFHDAPNPIIVLKNTAHFARYVRAI